MKKWLNKLLGENAAVDATDLKYMSYSSEAVLQETPRKSRLLLLSVALFILVMLIWSGFAEIDEFTRGQGKIVPSSDIQVVQNLEGGILADLYVSDGDIVEPSQQLMQIDDTIASSSFLERSLQISQLTIKALRLRAESADLGFDEVIDQQAVEFEENLLRNERELFNSRRGEFESRLDSLRQKASQKEQELSSARVSYQSIRRSYQLADEELNYTKPLVEQGAVSRVEFLRLQRQVNDLLGERERAELAIPQLQSALDEARQNATGYEQTFKAEVRAELNDVSSELQRLKQSNEALADRVKRTVVRSPVRGTVKLIRVKTIGGVIQPGMDLVEIVPTDDSLLVDAQVLPSDIAFIHPDQEAMIKFTAYDFSIHGGLKAKVVLISPDTIVDEEGNSFYQVRLQTVSTHLGNDDKPLPIIAGMTVQADIKTGRKSLLNYMLKPILKTRERAFSER